jgi:hypothetical protein
MRHFAFFLLAALWLWPQAARAQACGTDIAASLQTATIAVKAYSDGTTRHFKERWLPYFFPGRDSTTVFKVSRYYKGAGPAQITVQHYMSGAPDVNVGFARSAEYVLFLQPLGDGTYSVENCAQVYDARSDAASLFNARADDVKEIEARLALDFESRSRARWKRWRKRRRPRRWNS